MGAVAVAQHLHAMIALINNNNVTGGIERDTHGIFELASACSLAADGAQMLAAAVAQNLNTMIEAVGNNKVAVAVKRNTTRACSELPFAAPAADVECVVAELPVASALAADGTQVGAVAEPMHLHTTVIVVKDSDVALTINGDAVRIGELSVA